MVDNEEEFGYGVLIEEGYQGAIIDFQENYQR